MEKASVFVVAGGLLSCTMLMSVLIPQTAVAQDGQRRIALQVPGMGSVVKRGGIVYQTLSDSGDVAMYGEQLRFDVFEPAGAVGARPAVLLIHGGMVAGSKGPIEPKDLPTLQEWGRLLAASGFVSVAFSHRMTTDDNADIGVRDTEALIAHVRSRAHEWNIDPERLCVMVFSAGGPISSMFFRAPRPYVRCMALYYPFLDMKHAEVRTPFRGPHTLDRQRELAAYSPADWLLTTKGRVLPFLVARGGHDAIPGINASIDRFVQGALWVEAPMDFYIHPTGGHGFDRPVGDDARAREIIESTIGFFRRHLAGGR